MKRLSLKPYPGEIILTRTEEEHAKYYKEYAGREFNEELRKGCSTKISFDDHDTVWVVYWKKDYGTLAHELGHVLLDLFTDVIQSNPADGNGEPFCYMLSHLIDQAVKP